MRRKKHKNKKKQELFEEIEKQELAEQETKQLNEEIEDPEFRSFFQDVLKKFPQKTSTAIMNAFATSKGKAEQLVTNSQTQLDKVFDEFLAGVSPDVKKKSHQTIHFAALSAAIIGFSPIPFSDAFLLVPVQLTMMSRLHKIFGQSWSESLGKSLTKELVVVSLGESSRKYSKSDSCCRNCDWWHGQCFSCGSNYGSAWLGYRQNVKRWC